MELFTLVDVLSGCLLLTALLVVMARTAKRSTYLYVVQALFIVAFFVALGFATASENLFIWAATSFATKVVLVPLIFIIALRKLAAFSNPTLGIRNRPALIIALAAVEVLVCYVLIRHVDLPVTAEVKLPLAISLAHFFLGLTCIITQRDIFKQIFGYCLMENGSHITLALLASKAPELVEVGLVTDAIFAVLIMVIIASRIYRTNNTVDARELTNLKG
jgi:hydrogenase-4 component E